MAEQGPQSPQAAASQRGTGHEGRRHLRHRSSLSGHGRPWPRGDTVTLRNLGHGEVLSRVTCHVSRVTLLTCVGVPGRRRRCTARTRGTRPSPRSPGPGDGGIILTSF